MKHTIVLDGLQSTPEAKQFKLWLPEGVTYGDKAYAKSQLERIVNGSALKLKVVSG